MTELAENIAHELTRKLTNNKTANVPVGWKVRVFGQIFDFISSYSFSRNQIGEYSSQEDPIFYIHYGDIHAKYEHQLLDVEKDLKQIPVLNEEIKDIKDEHFLKEGDLVIADASEDYAGVGECIELKNIKNRKFIGGLHTFVARDIYDKTIQGYRAYLLLNPRVSIELKKLATGSKVYGISKSNLAKLKITLPPLAEQQKIAQILSTWDKAISKQQQLIRAKEQLKKGLMQQLLTGKMRFKEFVKSQNFKKSKLGLIPEDWELKLFEEVFMFINSNSLSRNSLGYIKNHHNIYNIHYGDIHSKFVEPVLDFVKLRNSIPIINHKENFRTNDFLINGDLIIADASEDYEGVGVAIEIINIENEQVVAGLHTIAARDNSGLTVKGFRALLLRNSLVKSELKKLATGSKVYGISKSNLRKLDILLPPLQEQQKIAQVLSAIDEEISILKVELDQLQAQKKGLMQQLLTGEVRVKIA